MKLLSEDPQRIEFVDEVKIYEDWQQGTRCLAVVACGSTYSTAGSTVPNQQWIETNQSGLHVPLEHLVAYHLWWQMKMVKQKMKDSLQYQC